METREYYIYQQIPSGGISYDTTECFKKDLSILPFNSVKNKELERYNNYTILEEFKGVE